MDLRERLIATEQTEDGGGLVGDRFKPALRLGFLAVFGMGVDLVIHQPDRIGTVKLLYGETVLQPCDVHLREQGHLRGNATLVSQRDAGIGHLHLGRQ